VIKIKIVTISFLLIVCTSGFGSFLILTTYQNSDPMVQSSNPNRYLEPQKLEVKDEKLPLKAKEELQTIESDKSSVTSSILSIDQIVGDTELFWVANVSSYPYEFYKINATLKVNGPHSLIYSNSTSVSDSELLDMNDSFETVVYPILTSYFGLPPDIDGNGKIILLVFDIDPIPTGFVAGFFYQLNQFLNTELHVDQRYSNEAEILHIDILAADDIGTIAHEFQHLIHFGHDEDEDTWLDEGASVLAEYLVGDHPLSGTYGTTLRSNPNVSLTYWDGSGSSIVFANYGASYTFILYLAEQYGGDPFVQDLFALEENGIESVEDALFQNGIDVEFTEVFRNWTIANFLDDTSFAGGSYGFYNESVTVNTEATYTASPLPRTDNEVPYWGTDYIKFNYPPEIPFNFEFQGDTDAGFLVTVILQNTTTAPFDTYVIPVSIAPDGFGNFSSGTENITADDIYVAISAYTEGTTPDHDNNALTVPSIDYWIMVNPNGLLISPGNLIFVNDFLNLMNITVSDKTGFIWETADNATYEILTEDGEPTGINGTLVYISGTQTWESESIDISTLTAGNYKIKYLFYNTTSSGVAYSEIFSTLESSTTTTTTTSTGLISGFLSVFVILALGSVISFRKRK
jgi:hypothetical protein